MTETASDVPAPSGTPTPQTGATGAGPRNLIFLCDGTLSSCESEARTNTGRLADLLSEHGRSAGQIFDYDRGVQGAGLERWLNAATGRTINLSIRRGYAFLASRYRPGDRIFLFGYSRGAYAVRSLAGMIGRVGLLRSERATERNVRLAFRHYEAEPPLPTLAAFRRAKCHEAVGIEMLGAWDTVRALGLPYPVLSYFAPMATEFHDHALGDHIRHGYHALGLDETRTAYAPIMWEKSPHWEGRLEQTWFPGTHGDVGGQVGHYPAARGLSNLALNWMLRRAERHGVRLPAGWEARFPEDAEAPSSAGASLIERLFVLRRPRRTGGGDGETIHMSVGTRISARRYAPSARPGAAPTPA